MGRCHHTTEATGTAPTEMGQSIQIVLIVSLLSLFPGSQGQGEECCAVKVVENSPDSSLDGTYTLSDNGAKREEICIDGCVYERDGLEYCFISKPVAESADVQCDDGFTGSTGTGSTMSPVSMDMTGSTFDGPMPTGSTFDGSMPTGSTFDGFTGSTGSAGPSTTQSLGSLSDAVNAAKAEADAALAEIAAADAAIEAASGASSALDDFDFASLSTPLRALGRLKRQADATTAAYPVPNTCDGVVQLFVDLIDKLTNDPASVGPLVVALNNIVVPLDTPCDADAVAGIEEQGQSAKSTADNAVAEQTNLKAAATDKYNAANDEINSLNEQIAAQGGSTIAAGTAAPTVATMFVETETSGSTFDGSMPTGSTFDFGKVTFDGSMPTGSTFDGSMPIGSTFDGSMPTGSTFDASMPTGSTFDGSLPTGSTFDGSVPTGSTFDASMPTGSTFDGSVPTGSTFDGSMPTGSTFDASMPTGST